MKRMKSRMKKTLFLALSTVAAMSIGVGVGSIYANAEMNDATKLESMKTGGASIRLTGNWGIRFQTTLDQTDYQDLIKTDSGIVTGVLAIPTDMLDCADQLTLANTDAANAVTYDGTANEWVQSEEDATLMESYAYLDGNDIPELSYTRNISFCGYYTYGGNTVYTEVKTRSMTYVAQAALEHDQNTTNANAEDKDKVLDDTQESKAKTFVKDYTVAYVDGVTGKLISTDTVSAGGNVADNKVGENPADPTLFGGEFAGWTSQNVAWKGTEETLTGDTVVKANYTASTILDFSTATEVPEYLVVNTNASGQDKGIAKIDETTPSLYAAMWTTETFTISYLEPMTLSEGDKLFVEVNAPDEKWFKMSLKPMGDTDETTLIYDYYTEQDSVEDFMTVTYEAPVGGITFQTLEFTHTQSISLNFYVKSVRIEKANTLSKYDYYNVNFANEDALPSGFVNNHGSNQYALDKAEGALWGYATHKQNADNSMFLKYPDIPLNAGDSITITMKSRVACTTNGGIYLNGVSTWIKNFSINTDNYETITYDVTGDVVLSSLYFFGYDQNYQYDLYIKSIVITDSDAKINETSIDFSSDASAANYYMQAVTAKSGAELVKDTVNGQEITVLKVNNVWKTDQMKIAFADIVLAANTKVTITMKAEAQGTLNSGSSVQGGLDMNSTWKANVSVDGEWNTVSFTVTEETTLSSLALYSYATECSFHFYIASIVIE